MLIRLGEIIKDAREYKEITQSELADYAGVSEEQVGVYVHCQSNMISASSSFRGMDGEKEYRRLVLISCTCYNRQRL